MDERDDKQFDAWIDHALSSDLGEPRTGIENRILVSIRTDAEQPRKRWWLAYAAVAACLILLASMLLFHKETKQSIASSTRQPQIVTPSGASSAPDFARSPVESERPKQRSGEQTKSNRRRAENTYAARSTRKPGRETGRRTAPKLEQFPAPTPLDPQERAMLALLRQPGPVVKQALEPRRNEPLRPLEIPRLEVNLLEANANNDQGSLGEQR